MPGTLRPPGILGVRAVPGNFRTLATREQVLEGATDKNHRHRHQHHKETVDDLVTAAAAALDTHIPAGGHTVAEVGRPGPVPNIRTDQRGDTHHHRHRHHYHHRNLSWGPSRRIPHHHPFPCASSFPPSRVSCVPSRGSIPRPSPCWTGRRRNNRLCHASSCSLHVAPRRRDACRFSPCLSLCCVAATQG